MKKCCRVFKNSKDLSAATVANHYVGITDNRNPEGPGEPPGRWGGYATTAFEVDGLVTERELLNLLSGLLGDGKQRLVPRRTRDRVFGFEICFQAPPDVSDLFAVGSPQLRAIVSECQEQALRETLWILQQNIKSTEPGAHGNHFDHGNIVYASFSHCTLNNQDPDLHSHVVIPNIASSDSGKICELNVNEMLKWSETLHPLFRNSLHCILAQRLQVEAYQPVVDGKLSSTFGLRGMPTALREKASWRDGDVSQNEQPLENSNAFEIVRPNRIELHEKWTTEAKNLGLTADSFAEAVGRTTKLEVGDRFSDAIKSSILDLTSNDKSFERPELIKAVSEKLQDFPIAGGDVVAVVDRHLQESPDLRTFEREGKTLVFDSNSVAKMELEVGKIVDRLISTPGLRLDNAIVNRAIESRPQLAFEQKAAVRHVLHSDNSLVCIDGKPGEGIADSMKAVCDSYKSQGAKVFGVATSAQAAQELKTNLGVECHSIEGFAKNANKSDGNGPEATSRMYDTIAMVPADLKKPTLTIDKKSVVILGEAEMLDTEQAKRILKLIDSSGAKIVACGNCEQKTISGKGFAFHLMAEQAGAVHISQESPKDKLNECFERLAKKGDVKFFADQSDATKAMIDDWSKEGGINRPQGSTIVAQTREEADRINVTCQSERLQKGAISQQAIRFGEINLHINDRLLFTKDIPRQGIRSGDTGTMVAVNDSRTIDVQLDKQSSKVTLDLATLSDRDITLGYSTTASQIKVQSLGKVYIQACDKIVSQHSEYVAITRKSPKVKVYQNFASADANLLTLTESTEKKLQPTPDQNQSHSNRLSISRGES